MPCRDRWGGLEAEGFGIVFVEAAAAGVPSVAGRSGGSHEAVVDGETGFVVDGRSARRRARRASSGCSPTTSCATAWGSRHATARSSEFSYDHLVERLLPVATGDLSSLGFLT